MTTTAQGNLLTATGAGNLPTALAAINGFIRSHAGDVPDPRSVSVIKSDYGPRVSIHFDTLDDLRHWAAYLQVSVTAKDARPQFNQIHHRADAKWGPLNGKMVEFSMVYIEKLPEPHACSDECDPGNCEVQHAEHFGLMPRDCEAGGWT